MYGFDEKTQSEEQVSNYMTGGIHEPIFITDFGTVKAEEEGQSDYFFIEGEDADGKIANRRYYEPKIDGNYTKTPAELQKAAQKFSKVLANFARKFLGETYSAPNASSTHDLCSKVEQDIMRALSNDKSRLKNTPLRTIIVYNTSGFPQFRGFAPAFELVSVPIEQSKLKLTEFDKVERPPMDNDTPPPSEKEEAPSAWGKQPS